MDQHPIPQNISSYEFRLVGDMTLKQFFQLAGGVVIMFVIYRLPLPNLIKLPLAGLSVLVGVLMAFVPVNGRPFSKWLSAFFRAVYSPTQFTWTSSSSNPPTPSTPTTPSAPTTPLDKFESQFYSQVTVLFSQLTQPFINKPSSSVQPLNPLLPQEGKPAGRGGTLFTSSPTPPSGVTGTLSVHKTPLTQLISAPTYPNIIAGVVQDPSGKTVEGAIVEIIDVASQLPVRALRTNRLGQFQIASPLRPGDYSLSTEKPGLTFPTISLTLTDQLIPPLQVTAQP